MAERPKTAAEIAEENGQLVIDNLNTQVNKLTEKIANLSSWAYQINSRLGWVISNVKAYYGKVSASDLEIDEETLNNFLNKINELESTALKIGDILVGDYGNN